MRRLILITGGQRSGKSTYAEQMALRLSPTPVYLATARIWDEEFRQRVIRHQERLHGYSFLVPQIIVHIGTANLLSCP